jgi:primosomal protein N' (replication factor Y)
VLRAAALGDPDLVVAGERERRRLLRLPPYGALAVVSGTGAADVVAQLNADEVFVGRDGDRYLVRADDWLDLGRALNGCVRPPGSRVRVEVDPGRI